MSFTEYLKSKSNLIILILAINSFALFVNYFHYRGPKIYTPPKEGCDPNYDLYRSAWKKEYFHVVFTRTEDKYDYKDGQENFYPFVQWIGNKKIICSRSFNGIFNEYDHIEFIVYTILLFIILYLRWFNSKNTK